MKRILFLLICTISCAAIGNAQDQEEKFTFPTYRIGYTPNLLFQRDASRVLAISQDLGVEKIFNFTLNGGIVIDDPESFSTKGVFFMGAMELLVIAYETSGLSLGVNYVYKKSTSVKRGRVVYRDFRYIETLKYDHEKKLNGLAFTANYHMRYDKWYMTLGIGVGPGTMKVENSEDVEFSNNFATTSEMYYRPGSYKYNLGYIHLNISYQLY